MMRVFGLVLMTKQEWDMWKGEMSYHQNVGAAFQRDCESLKHQNERLQNHNVKLVSQIIAVIAQSRLWKSRYKAACRLAGIEASDPDAVREFDAATAAHKVQHDRS